MNVSAHGSAAGHSLMPAMIAVCGRWGSLKGRPTGCRYGFTISLVACLHHGTGSFGLSFHTSSQSVLGFGTGLLKRGVEGR